MYVQKEHFKDQEVFLCWSSHCQDFPPRPLPHPPSSHGTTGHVIYNLNGMTVMEACVYVEPGGGLGRGETKKTLESSGPPFVHTSSAPSPSSALWENSLTLEARGAVYFLAAA